LPNSATAVTVFGDCRQIRLQIVAVFGNYRSSCQCGQGLKPRPHLAFGDWRL